MKHYNQPGRDASEFIPSVARLGLPAMGQRQRRAVYGKSVRTVRWGDGGRKTSSYPTGWGLISQKVKILPALFTRIGVEANSGRVMRGG
jgi:hypothetical protein